MNAANADENVEPMDIDENVSQHPHALKTAPNDVELATAAFWAYSIDPNRAKFTNNTEDPPLFRHFQWFMNTPGSVRFSEGNTNVNGHQNYEWSFWKLNNNFTKNPIVPSITENEDVWKITEENMDAVLERMYAAADMVIHKKYKVENSANWALAIGGDYTHNMFMYHWVYTCGGEPGCDFANALPHNDYRLRDFLPGWGLLAMRAAQLNMIKWEETGYDMRNRDASNSKHISFKDLIANLMNVVDANNNNNNSRVANFSNLCNNYCVNGIVNHSLFLKCATDAMQDGSFEFTPLWRRFFALKRPSFVPNVYARLVDYGSPTEFHIFDELASRFPTKCSKTNRRVGALLLLAKNFLYETIDALITLEEVINTWWDELDKWTSNFKKSGEPKSHPEWFNEDSQDVALPPEWFLAVPFQYRTRLNLQGWGSNNGRNRWICETIRNRSGSEWTKLDLSDSMNHYLIHDIPGDTENRRILKVYPPRSLTVLQNYSYRRELTYQIMEWEAAETLSRSMRPIEGYIEIDNKSKQINWPGREAFGMQTTASIEEVFGFKRGRNTYNLLKSKCGTKCQHEDVVKYARSNLYALKQFPVILGEMPPSVENIKLKITSSTTTGWAGGMQNVGIDLAPDIAVEEKLQRRTMNKLNDIIEQYNDAIERLKKFQKAFKEYNMDQTDTDKSLKVYQAMVNCGKIINSRQTLESFDLNVEQTLKNFQRNLKEWQARHTHVSVNGANRLAAPQPSTHWRWTDSSLIYANNNDWNEHPTLRYVASVEKLSVVNWTNLPKKRHLCEPRLKFTPTPVNKTASWLRSKIHELTQVVSTPNDVPDLQNILHIVQECETIAEALFVLVQQELLVSYAFGKNPRTGAKWPSTPEKYKEMLYERPLLSDNKDERAGVRKQVEYHQSDKQRFWKIANPRLDDKDNSRLMSTEFANKANASFLGSQQMLKTMDYLLFAMQEIGQVVRFGGFRIEVTDGFQGRDFLSAWRSFDPSGEDANRPMHPMLHVDNRRVPWDTFKDKRLRSIQRLLPRERQSFYTGLLDDTQPDARNWCEKMYGDLFCPPKWKVKSNFEFRRGTKNHSDFIEDKHAVLPDFIRIFKAFAESFDDITENQLEEFDPEDYSTVSLQEAYEGESIQGYMTAIIRQDKSVTQGIQPPYMTMQRLREPPEYVHGSKIDMDESEIEAVTNGITSQGLALDMNNTVLNFRNAWVDALSKLTYWTDSDANLVIVSSQTDVPTPPRKRWGFGPNQPLWPPIENGNILFTDEEMLASKCAEMLKKEAGIEIKKNLEAAKLQLDDIDRQIFAIRGCNDVLNAEELNLLTKLTKLYKHTRTLANLDHHLAVGRQSEVRPHAARFIADKMIELLKNSHKLKSNLEVRDAYRQARDFWFHNVGERCRAAGKYAFLRLRSKCRIDMSNEVFNAMIKDHGDSMKRTGKKTGIQTDAFTKTVRTIIASLMAANQGISATAENINIEGQLDSMDLFKTFAQKYPQDSVKRLIQNCYHVAFIRGPSKKEREKELRRLNWGYEKNHEDARFNVKKALLSSAIDFGSAVNTFGALEPMKRHMSLDHHTERRNERNAISQREEFEKRTSNSFDHLKDEEKDTVVSLVDDLQLILNGYDFNDAKKANSEMSKLYPGLFNSVTVTVTETNVREMKMIASLQKFTYVTLNVCMESNLNSNVDKSIAEYVTGLVPETRRRGVAYVRMFSPSTGGQWSGSWIILQIDCTELFTNIHTRSLFNTLKDAAKLCKEQLEKSYNLQYENPVLRLQQGRPVDRILLDKKDTAFIKLRSLVDEMNAHQLRVHERSCEFFLRVVNLVHNGFFSPSVAISEIDEFIRTNAMPSDDNAHINVAFNELKSDLGQVYEWEVRWKEAMPHLAVLRDANAKMEGPPYLMDSTLVVLPDKSILTGYDISVPTSANLQSKWRSMKKEFENNDRVVNAMTALENSNNGLGRNPVQERLRPLICAIDKKLYSSYNTFLVKMCLNRADTQEMQAAFEQRRDNITDEMKKTYFASTAAEIAAKSNPMIEGKTPVALHVAMELQREFSILRYPEIKRDVLIDDSPWFKSQLEDIQTMKFLDQDVKVLNAELLQRMENLVKHETHGYENLQKDLDNFKNRFGPSVQPLEKMKRGDDVLSERMALKEIAITHHVPLFERVEQSNYFNVNKFVNTVVNMSPTSLYDATAVANAAALARKRPPESSGSSGSAPSSQRQRAST